MKRAATEQLEVGCRYRRRGSDVRSWTPGVGWGQSWRLGRRGADMACLLPGRLMAANDGRATADVVVWRMAALREAIRSFHAHPALTHTPRRPAGGRVPLRPVRPADRVPRPRVPPPAPHRDQGGKHPLNTLYNMYGPRLHAIHCYPLSCPNVFETMGPRQLGGGRGGGGGGGVGGGKWT